MEQDINAYADKEVSRAKHDLQNQINALANHLNVNISYGQERVAVVKKNQTFSSGDSIPLSL